MSITETLLRPLLRTGSARPLITHYDDAAGTRVELSVATLANWAAKTANWLTDEFDVEPGTPVAVRLPAHWQTAGILLGCWWCGGQVIDDPAEAAVTFTAPAEAGGPAREARVPAREAGGSAGGGELAIVSLDPMGMSLREPPAGGAWDYVSEARLCADDYLAPPGISDDTPALLGSGVREVLTLARRRAEELGITDGSRVLSTLDWSLPDGVVDGFLAILAAGGSLVQCGSVAVDKLPDRRATERTTVELGVPS
ncbi:MAG: TIGR03089 family protein [Pseudonocardiaceae bacterium]|nr:TIGR03089 family protein [Pseudonocardiaceae bacterium]